MKLNRNEKYFKWGLTAFLVIVAAILFFIIFSNLSGFYDLFLEFADIISPVLFGCLFAYLMNPIMVKVQKLANRLLRKTKLSEKKQNQFSLIIGVTVALIVFLVALYAIFALIVPNLISSLDELLQKDKLESYFTTLEKWFGSILSGTSVKEWFFDNIDNVLQFVMDKLKSIDIAALVSDLTSSVYSFVMGVFNAMIGIVAAVYILIYKKQLCSQAKKIVDRIMPLLTIYLTCSGPYMRHVTRYRHNPDWGVLYIGDGDKVLMSDWCSRFTSNLGAKSLGVYDILHVEEADL